MANNPSVLECPADTWVKVATGVTSGRVHRLSTNPSSYSQTYRVTADPAPTDDDDASVLFSRCDSEPIDSDTAIDVYVKARGRDGSVRIDT